MSGPNPTQPNMTRLFFNKILNIQVFKVIRFETFNKSCFFENFVYFFTLLFTTLQCFTLKTFKVAWIIFLEKVKERKVVIDVNTVPENIIIILMKQKLKFVF